MTDPKTPPPTPTTPAPTPFQEARTRAQLRRPAGPRPLALAPLAQPRPTIWAVLRPRLRAGMARGQATLRLCLAPRRRGKTALGLALLTLTPLLGPTPRAVVLAGAALYLARLERRLRQRRAPHNFRWARVSAPSLR